MISTTLKNQLSQFCSKYEQPIDKLTYLLNNQAVFAKELSTEDAKTFEQLLTGDQSTLLCYFALENNSNTHLIVLTTEQLEQLKSLNLASDINALLDNPTVTYYHIYDDDYDCGLFTENDLRQYANYQQEYLPDVLDGEDDKVLLAELMAINPLTDDLDQVLRILDERGFNVDTYTANTVLDTYTANTVQELLSQIDTLIQR